MKFERNVEKHKAEVLKQLLFPQTKNTTNIVTNEKDIAGSLNEYFTEIGPSLSKTLDKTNAQFLDYKTC